jgi:hypothetical protein
MMLPKERAQPFSKISLPIEGDGVGRDRRQAALCWGSLLLKSSISSLGGHIREVIELSGSLALPLGQECFISRSLSLFI